MKVCIIGCGAIGGLYGAHLARLDDVEVWAFDLDRGSTWTPSTQNGSAPDRVE